MIEYPVPALINPLADIKRNVCAFRGFSSLPRPSSVSQSSAYRSAVGVAITVFRLSLNGGCLSERLSRVRQIVSWMFFSTWLDQSGWLAVST